MSTINEAAVLNPFSGLVANILNYVPRATTSEFGIVAIGSGINVDALGRIYLDTQEYSDRLTAIEAQAASTLDTQKSEVATAIAQVNLTQSQTITALTLEVDNLKTNLTSSITATQTDLINRADQLAQDVTDITVQLTQDKATFTQEIQDALDFLRDDASVASALRTPRKIQGVDFDGTQDISLPTFTAETDGLVPKRVGTTADSYLREDGTWVVPTDTTYALLTQALAESGTATTANTISAKVLKDAIQYHAPTVTDIVGNAGTATKLQTPRTINGISFDGSQDILLPVSGDYSLPTASASVLGGIKVGSGLTISNSVLSVGTLNQSTTGNAATTSKLQTARTISLTGNVTGSTSFDGSANVSLTTSITGLGAANGIATLDSKGQVPSTQLPSFVDDVLEYLNVAAFPATGETGKIYVETTGNITYRWSGTAYVKITSGEVASVAGKTGVVTLTKSDVGLANVDNTTDSTKNVASATKLTTARTLGGVSFDGTANINLPGVNTAGNQSTTGNAATATTLQTARTINGTSFNGAANITTTTWGTARTLTLGSTGKSVNGSANVSWSADEILPTGTSGQVLKHNGTSWIAGAGSNTTYSVMSGTEANTGTATSGCVITAAVLKGAIQTHAPLPATVTGNAGSATKLQTARLINGIAFDGTGDINLDVYSKAETNDIAGTPDATEAVAGKAKIATTAIAQAGTNDTDFLTAKKLRDALNAQGGAPISACRAWVCFDSTTGGTVIRASNNIQSIVRTAQGRFVITFIDEMPHSDYIVLTGTRADASANSATLNLTVSETSIQSTQNAKTTKTLSVLLGNSVGLFDSYGMSLGVVC